MLIALLVILVILILFFFLVGNYFCNIALSPKVSKKYILRSVTKEDQEEEKKDNTEGEKWLNEYAREIDILSQDNLRLHGYSVLNPIKKSDIWVILAHGYMGRAYEMVKYAKKFIEMGYNTLLIDLRAHGKSEGKYIGMGWKDRFDILSWINKLCFDNPQCKIILYGTSMGAATMMMTAGEQLPVNVKMCIEDCGYSSVQKQFRMMLKTIKPCIADYLMTASSLVAKLKVGYHFNEASSLKQIQKAHIPILFIHGDKDKFVPYEMLDELYEKANFPKEKLVIKNAGHVESSKINPDLYWSTVSNFIKKNI